MRGLQNMAVHQHNSLTRFNVLETVSRICGVAETKGHIIRCSISELNERDDFQFEWSSSNQIATANIR
jgi:hypothetical protein